MKLNFKKILYYGFSVVNANVGMIIRILSLNRIQYNPISLVSFFSTIKTNGKNAMVKIGKKTCVRIHSEVFADNGIILVGDNCFINRNCMIVSHEKIEIRDGVTIGPNVCIYDHDHDGKGSYVSSPIIIENSAWIGANSVICRGVHIGENAVIGAGAVVVHNVPANSVVGGVPAKVLRCKS